ncbi:MAG: 50S ribosomal protein L9 [Proteobacteria bacterium]|nr:50S ribosomal protein L9 [Pseudomonadota bacterium]MDA1355170.1 50S ribosomal protein L9 [Pseudomonadota bacterium]
MDIILLERIERLGGLGETVRVKDGYARNFLLPQKKALRATDANQQRFEHEREALEKINDERRGAALTGAEKIEGKDFVLIRQASDTFQLYGSVTARDIADAIIATGVDIKRQQVRLDRPIKTLGIFEVRVAVHPEVIVTVKANVARSTDEAETQAKGGSILPAHEQDALDEREEAEAARAEIAEAAAAVFEKQEEVLEVMTESEESSAGSDEQQPNSDAPGESESGDATAAKAETTGG